MKNDSGQQQVAIYGSESKSGRRVGVILAITFVAIALGFAVERHLAAQAGLQVSYGANGIQTIAYRGVVLEDLEKFPADALHMWHMKITDPEGHVLTTGQYGWGESNNGKQWDPIGHTWTYSFVWGSVRVQFQPIGDTLNVNVTETNNLGSGVVVDGVSIFPLVLHFPSLPKDFVDATYPQISDNGTGPSALAADYGSGMVAAVVVEATRPLFSGFMPAGGNAYTALISSTTPDGLAVFQPHHDRPITPGHADHFTVSLRFAPSGTRIATLATDAYQSWATAWPPSLNWPDRRIIGTVYLASSPAGDPSHAGGYPNNPRRYFNDSQAGDFDIHTADGLVKFQRRVLDQASAIVQNLQKLNAQGAITWDIEGEQYPQQTSYVCSPDQIAAVAPEMESVVTDPSSHYVGMKLDDAYFKTIRDAGFRTGVCVRPQHFTQNSDGTAGQPYLPNWKVAAEIIRKMKYAHDRWGATLFYLDSTVESDGAVLNTDFFQQAAAALPDSLLIPEETNPKFYAYTAPFKNFLFHGDLGTDDSVYGYYRRAFSATLVNDVDAAKLQAAQGELTLAVRHGDLLMVHADYWQANNSTVQQIYAAAGQTASRNR